MLFERGGGLGADRKETPNKKFLLGFSLEVTSGLDAFKNYAFAGLGIPRDLNVVFTVRETVAHGAFGEIFPPDIIGVGDRIGEGIGKTPPDFFKRLFAVFVPRRAPLGVAQRIHLLRKALSLLS